MRMTWWRVEDLKLIASHVALFSGHHVHTAFAFVDYALKSYQISSLLTVLYRLSISFLSASSFSF